MRARLALLAVAVSAAGCSVRALPVDPDVLGGMAVTSSVYAADGTLLTTLHAEEDRRPLTLDQIPQVLVDAVLAVEDRRFYEHDGVDLRGVARAAARNFESGETTQGGSTITQQLVKNTLVTPERTYRRKIREASLAMGLERTLTKEQILERYLNTVYFGQGAYGVGAAARVYFGHAATRLTLAEAALLAGLIRSPTRADPIRHPEAAAERRATVLRAMVETRAVSAAQAAAAGKAPVPRRARRDDRSHPAAYAVQDAVQTLLGDERLGATQTERHNAVFRGGLRIELTIDPAQQAAAEEAVQAVLNDASDPYAGVAAVKPGDGAITAMVGGRGFFGRDRYAKVNLARGGTTKRQAGSTFKVFALIAALQAGIEPDDTFEAGSRAVLPCRCPEPWVVDNYEGAAYGRITLRAATEKSVNTAYARVVQRIGGGDVDKGMGVVLDVAEALGVRGGGDRALRRDSGPAVVLGAQEVDPVQMAAAYAALGAGGVYARPYLVREVRDAAGRVLVRNRPARKQVVAPGVAATVNDVLRGVVRQGTGVRAAQGGRAVAGKTGTSTGYADAWFVGYTPTFAAAVWVGVPRAKVSMTPRNGFRTVIAGGTFPALIWGRFASTALLDLPDEAFTTPEGTLVSVPMDKHRGCRANRWTPESHVETKTFAAGEEPEGECADPTGPAATVVPSMTSVDLAYATKVLGHKGFLVETVEVYDARHRPGAIVGQQPAAGTTVEPGATVTLSIATRERLPVLVPLVLGLDRESAVRQIEAAGFVAKVVVEPSCTGGVACQARLAVDAGRVWRQDVAGGTRLLVGSTVSVALGPRQG